MSADTLHTAPPKDTPYLQYPDKKDYSEAAQTWATHYALLPDRIRTSDELILVDIDGVLVDWIAGFDAYARKRLAELGRPYPTEPMTYMVDLRAYLCPDDLDLGQQIIQEFQISDHAAEIPAFADALEYLPKIAEEFDIRYVAVSTAGSHPDIVKQRVALLEHHFGPDLFHCYHLLPPLTNKKTVLARYTPTIFIDDMAKQVDAARELGHGIFLLDRTNTFPDHHRRVTSWAEIHTQLREAYNADPVAA